jgi:hypothetical protein
MVLKRDFLLTVDVEALPARTTGNHVEHLIWGSFGNSNMRAGIREMVSIGNIYGVPITFFLDMAETVRYGDKIREVAHYLHSTGHDLELHLHPEILPLSYWITKGTSPKSTFQEFFSKECARIVLDDFVREFKDSSGKNSIRAYRAGSFRIGKAFLEVMHEHGIQLSSNLSYRSFLNQKRIPLSPPSQGIFLWHEGPVEVPITQIWNNCTWSVFSIPMPLIGRSYEPYFRMLSTNDDETPIVFILHSWSLLQYESPKIMGAASSAKIKRFERVCALASKYFNPISMEALAEKVSAGSIGPVLRRPFPDNLNKISLLRSYRLLL